MPRRTASLFAVAARRHHADAGDADLLTRWATARDADAFAELVRRYGPLVWRTCRAAAPAASAEDAFQATFLALARRAGSLRQPGAVAGWLHRTAGRAAAKARRRDRRLPPVVPATASPDPLDRLTARELLAAVDAELLRLPDRYRLPLLLCGVDGLSQDEAAARLGWSAGSLKGRLERGRATLRARLAARGLAVPAALGAVAVPDRMAAAAVTTATGGAVPAGVAELVPGGPVMGGWLWAKGLSVGFVAGVAVLIAGVRPAVGPPPAQPAPGDAPLVLWEGDTDGAGSGVWHPDGKHVVAVGAFDADPRKPQGVRAWDAASGKLVRSFPIPLPSLGLLRWGGTVAVGPDGRTVAAGTWRGRGETEWAVAVWDWDRPDAAPRLLPLRGYLAAVLFSPDGKLLYAVTHPGRISAFRVGQDDKEWIGADVPASKLIPDMTALSAAHHPTARVIAVGQNDGRVGLWDAGTLAPLDTFELRDKHFSPETIAFSPDGRRLAVYRDERRADGRQLVVGTFRVAADGRRVSDWRPGRVSVPLAPLRDGDGNRGGFHTAFHPDGRFLALGFREGAARVIDTTDGTLAAEWTGLGGPVWAVPFSPDGHRLLVAGNRSVRVYDVAAQLDPHGQ